MSSWDIVMVVNVNGQHTVQSILWVRRVLACPMRMLRIRIVDIENQGDNQLTEVYRENGC